MVKMCYTRNHRQLNEQFIVYRKMQEMKRYFSTFLFSVICLFISVNAHAQDQLALAQQYMSNGEYAKAADIYEYLYKNNPGSNVYYKNYLDCLIAIPNFKEAEKVVEKQMKKNPDNLTYYVDLGNIYNHEGNTDERDAAYKEAIDKITGERVQVIQLANAFLVLDDIQHGIEVYEKGKKAVKDYSFNYELGNLYYRSGSLETSIKYYLDYLAENEMNLQGIENLMQGIIKDDQAHQTLQAALYERIQHAGNDEVFTELLIWDFIQLKDFDGAFTQAKALDKRNKENGKRVFDLGISAENDDDYDAAITCFEYIIAKGKEDPFYFAAKSGILDCRRKKITLTSTYTAADLDGLKNFYLDFLNEYQKNDERAAQVTDDLAKLYAFYIHNTEEGIRLLEDIVTWPTLQPGEVAAFKLDLGDLYLISGNVWDATLLYSQVDKAMKDAPLGEQARFKNAKLAYYRGDFSFAQGMLDVLKASTSELVANDALELSVFITENLGLDSVAEPMMMYSRADLLMFQNKSDDANATLDSLTKKFPAHKLADDILYLKAEIALKKQDITTAVTDLENIRQNYAYELLADDAIFKLGELYQYTLKDTEKAKACYEEIILQHKDSLYVNEARKRFRQLRGDDMN